MSLSKAEKARRARKDKALASLTEAHADLAAYMLTDPVITYQAVTALEAIAGAIRAINGELPVLVRDKMSSTPNLVHKSLSEQPLSVQAVRDDIAAAVARLKTIQPEIG